MNRVVLTHRLFLSLILNLTLASGLTLSATRQRVSARSRPGGQRCCLGTDAASTRR